MNQPPEPTDDPQVAARQQRNAVVLGLALGAACLALMVACIILFKNQGLPKDPKEWKRMQQQKAAAEADEPQPQPQPQPQSPSQKDQPR